MAFLTSGDCCDLHIKLLAQMDHGIQAITTRTVATIAQPVMSAMLHDHPNIARAMYTAQLIDEGVMRAWIVSMGRRSASERVAHLICELYLRARNIGLTGDDEFALPLSQLVLAGNVEEDPKHDDAHDPCVTALTPGGIQRSSSPQMMRKSMSYGPIRERVAANALRTRSRSEECIVADRSSNVISP